VHGVDDVKLRDAVMGDLEIDEDVRDNSGDIASGGEDGVCYGLHESYAGTAIDEANAARGEGSTKIVSDLAVDGLSAIG
jgi:hypothetical protein